MSKGFHLLARDTEKWQKRAGAQTLWAKYTPRTPAKSSGKYSIEAEEWGRAERKSGERRRVLNWNEWRKCGVENFDGGGSGSAVRSGEAGWAARGFYKWMF